MKILMMFLSALAFTCAGCSSGRHADLNEKASIYKLEDLPENPLLLHPFTSTIYPATRTTSVLYGNTIGWHYAAQTGDGLYPPGAVLYEVTWHSAPDAEWFGGRTPEQISSVERIEFTNKGSANYTLYGEGLRKITDAPNAAARVAYLRHKPFAENP